jgi:single-stranded DNA-binding protein
MQAVAKAQFLGPINNIQKHETKTGKTMITFSIKTWKKDGPSLFHSIVAYSGSADAILKYLQDGSVLYCDCDITKSFTAESEKYQFVLREFSFTND